MPAALGSEIDVPVGPGIAGVFDSPDPGSGKSKLARLFDAENMFVPDPKNGSAILARHGMQGQLTQLGSTDDARTGQGAYSFRRVDGTVERLCFGGGRMYRWDGDETFTDITPAGVEIHESNPVFCSSLNGELLVTDEQNKPWIWTPEDGTADLIEYNDAHEEWNTKGSIEIFTGYPVTIVKAVGQAEIQTEAADTITAEDDFLLSTEPLSGNRNTITWGNAFDARTGFDQAAFDHVWQLTQTSGELLGRLFADEGALLYCRTEGMGRISGAIGEEWKANATRDGVSNTVGTDAPAAFIVVDKNAFFVDVEGRPYWMALAGEPKPLWLPLRREIEERFGSSQNRQNVIDCARVAYHKEYDLVLFTIWDRTVIYAFSARTGAYMGTWGILGGVHITAMGLLPDSLNRATFVVLGSRGTTFQQSSLGVLWKQKHSSDSSQWLDQADGSVEVHTAFTRAIETHWLRHAAAMNYRVSKVVAELVGDVSQHAVRLLYKTTQSALSAALVAQSSATVGAENDQDSIATAKWSLGRNAQGAAIRIRLEATHADNVRFGVHTILAKAVITQARPGSK